MSKPQKRANADLLRAVLEPRKSGALKAIRQACADGADPNRTCPDTSTAAGHVRGGSTLLTHSITCDASRVVDVLLECGADPNRADDNGWTPWMASTLADESKRDRIQASLSDAGASRDGEHIGQLARAVFNGDVGQAADLIQSDADILPLATFRTDLLGTQMHDGNTAMVRWLLEQGMPATSSHLGQAARAKFVEGVDLLLQHSVATEDADDEETLLMETAAAGHLDIVKRLVAAGADVNRGGHGNPEWTPAFYARHAGHKKVAAWLESQMSDEIKDTLQRLRESRNPKFRKLYDRATNIDDFSTDDIVAILERWDAQFDVTVKRAAPDQFTIGFADLPNDIEVVYKIIEKEFPMVAEGKHTVLNDLRKKKSLTVWWD